MNKEINKKLVVLIMIILTILFALSIKYGKEGWKLLGWTW